MLENQTNQREVFIISLLFITLFQRETRARVISLQHLISRRIQRRRRAAFSQILTVFAWRLQRRPKRVPWVLPRPQYWFETLFHSNALNMWWKENFRVSRETFNFIWFSFPKLVSQHDNSGSVTSAIADECPLVGYSGNWFFPFSALGYLSREIHRRFFCSLAVFF